VLLYLVRHAHAVTAAENPARPLSETGRLATARLGAFLRTTGNFAPAQLWHSPLDRARETATGLVTALAADIMQVETDDLLPEDNPLLTATRLAAYPVSHDLGLVGHEPHLSTLATLLVRGRPGPNAFVLRKGAALALERTTKVHRKSGLPRWRVRWHLSPELLKAFA
jgi:phosphohistidine phosphatase